MSRTERAAPISLDLAAARTCLGWTSDLYTEVIDCTESDASWDDPAAFGTARVAPDASLVLLLDPYESFLHIESPGDEVVAALSGGGSIGVTPLEFLSGLVWVESPKEFGGDIFTNWTFTFETAVDIDYSAGTIDVDVADSPLLEGGGKVDGTQYGLETVMNNPAYGTINVGAGTWSLYYTETISGWTTDFYLEGTLALP